jgi:hypothetical protein
MTTSQRTFGVYVPLPKFHWDGDACELAPGVRIERNHEPLDLSRFKSYLTPQELNGLPDKQSHWATFEVTENGQLSSAEVTNLMLLALWLAKATEIKAAYRFEIGKEKAEGVLGMTRLFDQFQYVKGSTHKKFEDKDLQSASSYFKAMLTIQRDTRLFMAQILTLNACWQHQWHAAILFFATATEALLTYSESHGLTKRLAIAYACLLHIAKADRDAAFSDFRECYATRSDIVHGRSLKIPKTDRLANVVRWQNLIRNLWVHILQKPKLVAVLNGSDAQREAYIAPMVNGYVPPP